MQLLNSIQLDGLLSFPPGREAIPLTPLNVLIGPNGSGKSNLIEAIELLHATPTALASAIRDGGGVREWLWKGAGPNGAAHIEALIDGSPRGFSELRYRLDFDALGQRMEVIDEALENAAPYPGYAQVFFYYRFQRGDPVISVQETIDGRQHRKLERQSLLIDESVLSQRKDPDQYPVLTWVGQQFARIHTFREWRFGRYAQIRQGQPANLPSDVLLDDSTNLGLVLNNLEYSAMPGQHLVDC